MKLFSVIVTIAYAAACAGYVKFALIDGKSGGKTLRSLAVGAAALDFFFLIALRSAVKHPPLTTGAEATAVLSFMLVAIYLILERYSETKSVGALIYGAAAAMQGAATVFMKIVPGPPQFNDPMLFAHVGVALMGYAAFTIAFIYSAMYLAMHRQLKRGSFGLLFHRLPSLEELDDTTYRAAVFGFIMLCVSILLGFAQVGGGQLLMGDPKVAATVFTAQVYLIILVAKIFFGWRGVRIALMSAVGFIAVAVSIFLLNVAPYTFHNIYY